MWEADFRNSPVSGRMIRCSPQQLAWCLTARCPANHETAKPGALNRVRR
ncbi:hypothetical protein AS9A_1565 [Hoyosella subflava DQS3-9A1]|uniref:Uncharacterized protein n=1 Tax=Hoyosella subflava (strain DSM 45089 / JCM 17490 / NBRC 109087 / DQS3-9A1) TaxID=443218 RepID=F6EIV3_HOYSD|nr:hypothetical protein AS9A_1565 [Hoyosella subflava DQS3-9A1]